MTDVVRKLGCRALHQKNGIELNFYQKNFGLGKLYIFWHFAINWAIYTYYKHTQPEIMDFLSISLSIFPASDLPGKKFYCATRFNLFPRLN